MLPAAGFSDIIFDGDLAAGFSFWLCCPGMSLQNQMVCHADYTLAEYQVRDMELLHARFGIEYPKELTRPQTTGNSG
jgi:hypothetical protein